MNFIKEFTGKEKLSFTYGILLGAYFTFFLLVPVNTASAEQIQYIFPTWGDISSTNPPTKPNDAPDDSDRIGYDGSDELITAFTFCLQLGYSYVNHFADSNANPTAVYEPPEDEWEQKNSKPVYLEIICDDGTTSTSTINIDVQVDVPDYTDYIKYFLVFFTSLFFMAVVAYFTGLVKKFS